MTSPSSTPQTVCITGAAGGLGCGLVEAFSAQGWRVAALHHRRAAHAETDRLWPIPLDVANAAQVRTVFGQILERWSTIDVLVNNAGVTADDSVWQLGDEAWATVLAVNLKGAFLCSREVLRPMIRQGQGHIIHVSSYSGRAGARGQANYAAAKAALLGLTASMAKEVGSRNIKVNAILPGVLPTPMTAQLERGTLDALAAANALGRLNAIEEVALFTVFLATMRNVSGQLFQLDSRVLPWT